MHLPTRPAGLRNALSKNSSDKGRAFYADKLGKEDLVQITKIVGNPGVSRS